MTMKTNDFPQANQLDNVHIISLLDRLEAAVWSQSSARKLQHISGIASTSASSILTAWRR